MSVHLLENGFDKRPQVVQYASVSPEGAREQRDENIVYITQTALELLQSGRIDIEKEGYGFPGLVSNIVMCADAFEAEYPRVDWCESELDYWDVIDKFAEMKLLERYGVPEKEVEKSIEKSRGFVVDTLLQAARGRAGETAEMDGKSADKTK